MEFKDELRKYTERLENIKDTLQTEEATKMSLIVPFFQLLGYDVFNPLEFCPEYTADIGIKKGEKVDYAILMGKDPVILIEARPTAGFPRCGPRCIPGLTLREQLLMYSRMESSAYCQIAGMWAS